jgi:hypothetical protein
LFAHYILCELTINHRFKFEGSQQFLESSLDIGFFSINIAMDFQKNLLANFGDHEPAKDECAGSAARHVTEERCNIVRVRADATMGSKLIDARRSIRAVNTVTAETKS